MEESVINEVADAWVEYQARLKERGKEFENSEEEQKLWPTYSKFMEWSLRDPEATWATIVAIWNRIDHGDMKILSLLGAGEVEDLLCNFGEDYFPLIEKFCTLEPEFKTVLRMVWQSSMSNDLWQKVQDLRGGGNL